MRLHYKGKYNLNPDSLPHGEHIPGAVKFKEADDSKQLSIIANGLAIIIMFLLAITVIVRCKSYFKDHYVQVILGFITSMLVLFPHELLHAICFREDVYLYTNLEQGMLFVVGPEKMSKRRFIFMSLLPNLIFGLIPYVIGMLFPRILFLAVFGTMSLGCGAGDYYNVFNAVTQMPKHSKTYLYGLNSYWYIPKKEE